MLWLLEIVKLFSAMFSRTPVRIVADYLRWRLPTWWRCTRPCTRSDRSLQRSTSHIKKQPSQLEVTRLGWQRATIDISRWSADAVVQTSGSFYTTQSLLQFKHGCWEVREAAAFITWQPRTALRKVRTVGDMGAAPVTITRTRPPRDSYRRERG